MSDRQCKSSATVVGFMGGYGEYPSYETNYTALNYSETLRLVYDPALVSYSRILQTYWQFAPQPQYPQQDPAYKLRIFVSPEQRPIAEESLLQEQTRLNATVYAEILNASDFVFWKAGEYHQQFDYKEGMRCGAQNRTQPNTRPQK